MTGGTAEPSRPGPIIAVGEPLVEFTAEGPGRLRDVGRFGRGWGGDTSNLVIAAARLGASCRYVTRVGDDEFGQAFVDVWRREGVDISHVRVDRSGYTAFYFVTLSLDGQRGFTYHRKGSAASRLGAAEVEGLPLSERGILHTSGITAAISRSAAAAARAAAVAAARNGVRLSYDANVRPLLAPPAVLRSQFDWMAGRADVLFLSEEDMGHLGLEGADDPALARLLGSKYGKIVVFTEGASGCRLLVDGCLYTVPGHQVTAVDTTGAGDAFAGAFLTELTRGASPYEAARFANAAAALSTTGRGAVDPLPDRSRVELFLRGDAT